MEQTNGIQIFKKTMLLASESQYIYNDTFMNTYDCNMCIDKYNMFLF